MLAGRAAELSDRMMGWGALEAMVSGMMAARAIIQGLDYHSLVKPLQDHIENISAIRHGLGNLDDEGYDKMLSV